MNNSSSSERVGLPLLVNREVVEAIKRLKQGVEGVEQRVPEMIGGDDFSDDEDNGRKVLSRRRNLQNGG